LDAREEIAQDLSPAALVNVIEADMFSFFPSWRRWTKAEVHDDPELLWTLTSIPSPFFNSVFRARLIPEAVEGAIFRFRKPRIAYRDPVGEAGSSRLSGEFRGNSVANSPEGTNRDGREQLDLLSAPVPR